MCRKQLIEPARLQQTMMHAFPGAQAFADLLRAEGITCRNDRGDEQREEHDEMRHFNDNMIYGL
jgi:hypothetical protein